MRRTESGYDTKTGEEAVAQAVLLSIPSSCAKRGLAIDGCALGLGAEKVVVTARVARPVVDHIDAGPD